MKVVLALLKNIGLSFCLELQGSLLPKFQERLMLMYYNFLWKTCRVGASPDGKHTVLEVVTIVLDLPPPYPGSMSGISSVDKEKPTANLLKLWSRAHQRSPYNGVLIYVAREG
ncbi:uncharacterized protein [Euphorbia lathyris]|uniref:uncharacterized protein isoform X1 n=2 Tax=Euphorbia lathyris TaxID=212925 RepID=UPI00331332F0